MDIPTGVLAGFLIETAVLERDKATANRLGGKATTDFQEYATAKCRLWWWKGSKSTDKSASQQYARPQATVNETGGGMVVPIGTDVTDQDRIARVLSASGEVLEEGPFRILAVNRYETHVELSLERP